MKKYTYLLFLLSISLNGIAQETTKESRKAARITRLESRKFSHNLVFGLNFGALAPVSLPENVRKIKAYNPEFSPSFGYEFLHHFTPQWSLGFSAKVDYKGMSITDSVVYFHTSIQQSSNGQTSSFEGDFSGTNHTYARNVYFTLPVYAVWTPGDRWFFRLGGYVAYLWDAKFQGDVSNGYIREGNSLGQKVLIDHATFDFSKEQRKWDYGMDAGAGIYLGHRWTLQANLQWGFRPIFPSDFTGISFKMYNIFANLGASIRI